MKKNSIKKRLASILVTAFFLILSVGNAHATEEITSYQSDITVNQDTTLTVTEDIAYTTTVPKHGILRYIPLSYSHDDTHRRLRINVIEVSDGFAMPHRYETYVENGNLVLKIGDPDKTFSGDMRYQITYTVDPGLIYRDENPVLSWDITGEGWTIPISSVSATVRSPHAEFVKIDCYAGLFGTDNGLCTPSKIDENTAQFTYGSTISYNENMTTDVTLSADNELILPTEFEQFMRFLRDNWQLFVIPIPALISAYLWYTRGRDWVFISQNIFDLDPNKPQQLRPVFDSRRTRFVYEPLSAMTPGEAGLMLDERVDNHDVIAEIIDLAHKKYFKIEEKTKKILVFKQTDYLLSLLRRGEEAIAGENAEDDSLPPHQAYLLKALFGSKKTVTISSLKGTFHTKMAKVKEMINTTGKSKGWFSASPSTSRTLWMTFFGIAQGGMLAVAIMGSQYGNGLWHMLLLMISTPIALYFAYHMPQKTAVGSNLAMQAHGLKYMIKTGKWRQEINEKRLFIEDVLPFAISLGVVDQLSKHMKDLNLEPPSYVAGMSSVSTSRWTESLTSFNSSASSTLSYNPSSSSSSGGGGFSGGGGGGGGGGSW